uniref:Uncharacterized protein n=1 Tax=Anguilla anguilla TaxID=7936 RepID=A0A0E9UP45_ANGAN
MSVTVSVKNTVQIKFYASGFHCKAFSAEYVISRSHIFQFNLLAIQGLQSDSSVLTHLHM